MKVVVTGSNGFIGKPLCHLLREHGHVVKSIVRDNPHKDDIAVGDISLVDHWSELFYGYDAVVHLAALVHEQKPSSTSLYDKINTYTVETLMHAAAQVGVKRFVFLSTAAVYNNHCVSPYKETDVPSPATDYGRSKLNAEYLITRFCKSSQLTSTVFRPPMVYGPNAKANFKALVKLVDSGMPLPLASIANMRSFIYVENLAHIIEACLHQRAMENEIFNVSDLHDLSTTELVQMIAKHLGKKERLFHFPSGMMRVMATAIGKRTIADKLLDSFRLDCSKITSYINWTPPFTVEQAIEMSVSPYRKYPEVG